MIDMLKDAAAASALFAFAGTVMFWAQTLSQM